MSLYSVAKALVGVVNRLVFRVKVKGECQLPEGPVVLCPNHLSYMDPLFVACAIDRRLTAIAKQSLFDKPVLGWFLKKLGIIPVNRDGGDFAAVRAALAALKDSQVLAIFPQGTRCPGVPLSDELVRGGAAMMALKAKAKVVPVSITTKDCRVRPFRKVTLRFGESFFVEELFDGEHDRDFVHLSKGIFARVMELDRLSREEGGKS